MKENRDSLYRSKPLPISGCRVAHGSLPRDQVSVETIDSTAVFAEMAGLKAEPLNVCEKRNQQITDSRDKSLQFIVIWILPKIIV
jgi:hypothetical protein